VNPFKAFGRGAKKVVTAPVKAVRNTARLLKIRSEAEDVLIVAEEAEADPRLYRDLGWWKRLMKEAGEAIAVLPIAQELKNMDAIRGALANYKTTLAGVGLIIGAITAFANDVPLTDEKVWMAAITGIGLILGKDFNMTGGTKAATPEAKARTAEK
jgi:NCAIR mutase (PurE)-related protein